MEIINEGQAEKHRLHALLRLVAQQGEIEQSELYDLLQPQATGETQEAQPSARATLLVARECRLVTVDEQRVVRGMVPPADVESLDAFHTLMVRTVLGVTTQDASNFLLNLFAAWYAVQDERVLLELVESGYDGPFNDQVFPDAPTRPFNTTKFVAWRKWAVFLGLGWILRLGSRELLVPDATRRVQPMLAGIFGQQRTLTFARFMQRLANACPELDGGSLFTYCWQASRGGEERGHQLSLMLSTALRTLDGLGNVRLQSQADALETWQLYPAEGSRHQQVTHIAILGENDAEHAL